MAKAVVTGGAGFIGSHLVERLISEGYEILIIDNLVNGSKRVDLVGSLGADLDTTDISAPEVGDVIAAFAPKVVFHLAAQMDVRRSVADPVYDATVNILGTLRVLEAAAEVKARVVFSASGGCMYGDQDPSVFPISEEIQGRPDSPYGISKKIVEDYLRFYASTHNLEFVSLALGNVYGPRQDPAGEAGVVAIFGEKLISGETCTIYGDGKQTRDYVFVGDVVDAFLKASRAAEGETVNIATGEETSVNDLFGLMASIADANAQVDYLPARPGELQRNCLNIAKAKTALDWEPKTSLEQGLRITIDSFR